MTPHPDSPQSQAQAAPSAVPIWLAWTSIAALVAGLAAPFFVTRHFFATGRVTPVELAVFVGGGVALVIGSIALAVAAYRLHEGATRGAVSPRTIVLVASVTLAAALIAELLGVLNGRPVVGVVLATTVISSAPIVTSRHLWSRAVWALFIGVFGLFALALSFLQPVGPEAAALPMALACALVQAGLLVIGLAKATLRRPRPLPAS